MNRNTVSESLKIQDSVTDTRKYSINISIQLFLNRADGRDEDRNPRMIGMKIRRKRQEYGRQPDSTAREMIQRLLSKFD